MTAFSRVLLRFAIVCAALPSPFVLWACWAWCRDRVISPGPWVDYATTTPEALVCSAAITLIPAAALFAFAWVVKPSR